MPFFHVEITDTFAGEANYSWVRRYQVKAQTMRGAVNKLAREIGAGWHCVSDFGDFKRYDSRTGCRCFFIESFDIDKHGLTSFEEI